MGIPSPELLRAVSHWNRSLAPRARWRLSTKTRAERTYTASPSRRVPSGLSQSNSNVARWLDPF